MAIALPLKGRGTADNPASRFEPFDYEPDAEALLDEDGAPAPRTLCYIDATKSVITSNDSPDVGPGHYVNPYRGCEHGCIYCFARPYHEYLGFSVGLDFETKILVKPNAPALLRKELMRPSWKGAVIGMSGSTDCYQPLERTLKITRGCLEVMAEFRQPVGIVTKNRLVVRDADLLADLARHGAACVWVSLTTLDESLCRKMEPRATGPTGRLAAIRELAAAGVPVGTLIAPIIPGLTEHEAPALLAAAREAGAAFAGYTLLRLPHGLKELFTNWLENHFPDRKERVLGRVRDVRDGRLNDPNFKTRMKGTGSWAELIGQVFKLQKERLGYKPSPPLSSAAFRRPGAKQLELFSAEG